MADLQDRLGLDWVSPPLDMPMPGISSSHLSNRPALAGFLNLIHPNKVQVLGEEELRFIHQQSESERKRTMRQLVQGGPLVILVGDGLDMPHSIIEAVAGKPIALMRSGQPA